MARLFIRFSALFLALFLVAVPFGVPRPDFTEHESEHVFFTPPDISRPVYAYSVIPGGVRSSQEVATESDADPVVREHYADVRTTELRPIVTTVAMRAYVSYRIGSQVYWTHRPINIPAGEPVLTDGEHLIRQRCGNRITPAPEFPKVPVDPTEDPIDATLEAPEPDIPSIPDLAVAVPELPFTPFVPTDLWPGGGLTPPPPPGGGTPGGPGGPPVLIPPYGPPPSSTPTPPPAVTPEPGSISLIVIGIGALASTKRGRAILQKFRR